MSGDKIQPRTRSYWIGAWGALSGLSAVMGWGPGVGLAVGFTQVGWPLVVGSLIGSVCVVAIRSRWALSSALASGLVAVVAFALTKYHLGAWPMDDGFTVAHYGGEAVTLIRAGVTLGMLVCGSSVFAAMILRGCLRRSRWDTRVG